MRASGYIWRKRRVNGALDLSIQAPYFLSSNPNDPERMKHH